MYFFDLMSLIRSMQSGLYDCMHTVPADLVTVLIVCGAHHVLNLTAMRFRMRVPFSGTAVRRIGTSYWFVVTTTFQESYPKLGGSCLPLVA